MQDETIEVRTAPYSKQEILDQELAVCVTLSYVERVRNLLKEGANPNSTSETFFNLPCLVLASANGDQEIVDMLLQYEIDKLHLNFAFNYAANNGHPDTVRLLIKHGADASLFSSSNIESLYYYAKQNKGAKEVIDMLIEHGVEPYEEEKE